MHATRVMHCYMAQIDWFGQEERGGFCQGRRDTIISSEILKSFSLWKSFDKKPTPGRCGLSLVDSGRDGFILFFLKKKRFFPSDGRYEQKEESEQDFAIIMRPEHNKDASIPAEEKMRLMNIIRL